MFEDWFLSFLDSSLEVVDSVLDFRDFKVILVVVFSGDSCSRVSRGIVIGICRGGGGC